MWSMAGCRRFRKKHWNIVSDTERMKNTPIHVCAKTTIVDWPTESMQISFFHNFLSFSHYFRKYIKLLYRKNMVMVTSTLDIMFLLFTCMHFRAWGILQRWSARVPSACVVVCDCQKFHKRDMWQCALLWEFFNIRFNFYFCVLRASIRRVWFLIWHSSLSWSL
jgi:hypothetical protein